MTRVVRFHEYGGPDVLRIEDAIPVAPSAGDVRIRVKALGLNRAEALLRAGAYIERPALPAGLGLEAAGVVEAIGAGVDKVAVGDTVSVIPPLSMVRYPAYGEVAIFPAHHVVKHPASLSLIEAAALWMPFLTAYGALVDIAQVGAGDFVAITAASSSVGLAAIQIANRLGATPIAITRSAAKAQALREAGAAHVIASAEEDMEARLLDMAGPAGIRVVFDAVGGPIFEPLTAAMARGGILIEYGGLSPAPTPFPLFAVLSKSLTLRGYLVHEVTGDKVKREKAKGFILDGVTSGLFKPTVAITFPFDGIVEAHRFLESNRQVGKVVVTV